MKYVWVGSIPPGNGARNRVDGGFSEGLVVVRRENPGELAGEGEVSHEPIEERDALRPGGAEMLDIGLEVRRASGPVSSSF